MYADTLNFKLYATSNEFCA